MLILLHFVIDVDFGKFAFGVTCSIRMLPAASSAKSIRWRAAPGGLTAIPSA